MKSAWFRIFACGVLVVAAFARQSNGAELHEPLRPIPRTCNSMRGKVELGRRGPSMHVSRRTIPSRARRVMTFPMAEQIPDPVPSV